MLKWLIIGGGVQGTMISRALVGAGVERDRLVVLDPHPEPLERFFACAAATGMRYLRSSVVHHLDDEPMSLRAFAERWPGGQLPALRGAYLHPSLEVFAAHGRFVVERHGLRSTRRIGEAHEISRRSGGGFRVETSVGRMETRRLLLALGDAEALCRPAWAEDLRRSGGPVQHLFEPGFRRESLAGARRIVVIGGGLSALQAALSLGRSGAAVTLVSRHRPRVHDFDTDSGWMGPRLGRVFARQRDRERRRRMIDAARHRGSAPAPVARELERRRGAGELTVRLGEVAAWRMEQSEVVLDLEGGEKLVADRVLLATGFDAARPGGPLVDRAIERLGLQYAGCGYPVVDRDLRWARGLFVTGSLAELEIGPVARNIHGARLAAQRLGRVARS